MIRKCSLHKKLILSSSLLILSFSLFAENFRVSKVHVVNLSEKEQTEKLGITEALAIYLPEDKIFIEGLEIKMEIPEAVASWMDSIACTVYDKINPLPTTSQIDYSGTRQYVSTLPGRLSWVLQIPLKQNNNIKADRYTTKIDTVPEFKNNVVFIRLQPVMKGVPDETLNAIIPMTVKPLLIDKGQLELEITNAENTPFSCSVYIDDNIVKYTPEKNKILIDTGVHTVSVISEAYRNEIRTVRIDQARNTKLNILMKSTEPTLTINSPESAKVLLDGNPCSIIGKEFVITEGEHKISFTIGDYEIVRTIQAFQGKSYTANFSVDLDITEE